MPIVPKYENNVPGVVESGRGFGAPVDNVRPSFDYENVMNRALQPWSQIADSAVKIEAYHRDTVVKARADEQLDAYNKEVQTTLYDPEKGYFSQQGKNAVMSWDQAQSDLQSIYDKHLSQIDDPDVKEAFKSNALQRLNSVRQKTVVYRNEQNIRWRAQTSKDHADNLVEEFALGGFSPDGQRTMASLMNEIEYQGRMQGWDEETLKRQKNAYKSLAYASAYSNMALSDPIGALRHFQTDGSKEMSTDVGRRTYQMLFHRAAPQLVELSQRYGGATALALTPGAVARTTGDNTNENVLRQSRAQAGLGQAPKVSDKVLNTSGYKGCNPLNVRASSDKWRGSIGQSDNGYVIFSTPMDGIRAAATVIKNYGTKYGINTVRDIVSRYAPASENPTDDYIANVCKGTGYQPDEKLDTKNPEVLKKLVTAMMRQEIGDVPYSEETINEGVQRALGNVTPAQQTAEDQAEPRLTAADLVFNPNVKTGIEVIDSLNEPEKLWIMQHTKAQTSQSTANLRSQFKTTLNNALAVARSTGDMSQLPDVGAFIQTYGQEEGLRQFQNAQQEAKLNANLFLMPTLSNAEIEATARQMTPSKDDPNYAARMKDLETWNKAYTQIRKERAEDPVQFAFSGMPDLGLQPITDWTSQDGALLQIQKRIDSMDQVAERFGTPRALFSKAEISGFLNFMQGMDAVHQADFLNRMADRMTDPTATTSEPLRIFSEQIGNKNQTLAIALGVASTPNGKEMNGALRQINGDYIKKQKIGEAWKDEKEMRTLLSGVLAVSDGSPAYEAMLSAAMNEHCYANQSSSQAVAKSVENVFGKVYEHNGKKIFLPTQLDKAQKNTFTFRQVGSFEDLLSDAGKDLAKSKKSYFYGGQKLTSSQLENLVSAGQLQSIDDGVYQLVNGLNYVRDEKGQPLVIDLNTYISRRTKR
nr:MAG TPA: virion protein [Caudoviricetes sp.]